MAGPVEVDARQLLLPTFNVACSIQADGTGALFLVPEGLPIELGIPIKLPKARAVILKRARPHRPGSPRT